MESGNTTQVFQPAPLSGLVEGRVVHYVMPNGQHRAADIVRVWSPWGTCNLSVKTDYLNDKPYGKAEEEQLAGCGITPEQVAHGHFWQTSVRYSEAKEPNTWHWIEKA